MRSLRRFRWSDLDGVLAVRNAGDAAPAMTRTGLEAFLRNGGLRPDRDMWVVELGSQLVAFGSLSPWHSLRWLQAEVLVHPDWREQGLGAALVHRLIQVARRRGMEHLAALANDDAPGVGRFLQKQGFDLFVARQHMRLHPIAVAGERLVPGFRVRLASEDESGALAELTNVAYADTERVGRADAEGYRRYLRTSGARVWIAEEVDCPGLSGLCEVRSREVELEGTTVASGHIGSLAIAPERRLRGLGRWLLTTAIRDCLEAGWPSVELNVDGDNEPALRLYSSMGFRTAYTFRVYRRSLV